MNRNIMVLFRKIQYEKIAPFVALAVLFVASSVLSPYFLQVKNLLNILRQVSYSGMIALGMTFVIISGGIDLSVGSLAAFNASMGILCLNYLMNKLGNEYLAMAGGILTALLLGVCPTTVRRYTNRGALRCMRTPGNQRRFRLSDILEFMEHRENWN